MTGLDAGDLPIVLIPAGGASARMIADLGRHKLLLEIPWPDGPRTMIASFLHKLSQAGFERFHVLLGDRQSQATHLVRAAAERWARGREVTFSYEAGRLGTAGAVYSWTRLWPGTTAAVAMPDTFFDLNALAHAATSHLRLGSRLTFVVTTEGSDRSQNAGKLLIGSSGTLLETAEVVPPVRMAGCEGDQGTAATSAGAVVLDTDAFNTRFDPLVSEVGRAELDLHRDFVPWLLRQGVPVDVFDVMTEVMDVGTRERYESFVDGLRR